VRRERLQSGRLDALVDRVKVDGEFGEGGGGESGGGEGDRPDAVDGGGEDAVVDGLKGRVLVEDVVLEGRLSRLEAEEVLQSGRDSRGDGVLALSRIDENGDGALVFTVADEGVLVRLSGDGNPGPLELDDVDGGAVEVGVGVDEVKSEVEGELFGLEDVRGLLGEDVDGVPVGGGKLVR
jgi:hypothetical protein